MRNNRINFVGGAILVGLGLLLLLAQFVPGVGNIFRIQVTWPFIVVGIGIGLFVLGLILGEPSMAVPACIVGGIGMLLWWQNITGAWESWAYVWTLIPGFVGVGVILSSLLGGEAKVADGIKTVLVSLVMFAIFGSFFGVLGMAGKFWPLLLILLGVVVLLQSLFGNRD
jgi:hypothetical protein